jgi:antibiotic biosynthesis monooxygenase (ABM) superfamily enzyme
MAKGKQAIKNKQEDTVVTSGKSVTVVVSRTLLPGQEKKYNEWVQRFAEAVKGFPGNTGVTFLVPPPGREGLRHIVLYFKDKEALHRWEDSYVRQKFSWEADAFSRKIRQEATGLETWFSIPECPELESPKPWKQAVVTWVGVFLGSCLIIYLIDMVWKEPNFFAFNAVVGALLVSLLTWAIMPVLSRYVFRKWLHK